MALDRWIALIFVTFCGVYGYAAFFTMDQLLPPFMQRNPVWPSTFPKVLSVLGIIVGLIFPIHPDSARLGVTLATLPLSSLKIIATMTTLTVPILYELCLGDPYPLGNIFLDLRITELSGLTILRDNVRLL